MIEETDSRSAAALACLSGATAAAGGGIALDKFPTDRVTDLAALQNGAKLFVNYCLNCHSASYMRYNRMRGHRPDRGADQEQPDVRRREGRRHDDDRHEPGARQGLVRCARRPT